MQRNLLILVVSVIGATVLLVTVGFGWYRFMRAPADLGKDDQAARRVPRENADTASEKTDAGEKTAAENDGQNEVDEPPTGQPTNETLSPEESTLPAYRLTDGETGERIRKLLRAMVDHHDARLSFPPAANPVNFDESGRPRLSWRVHLLPFLDETELYERFRLNESWDSSHNRALLAEMPGIYRTTADPHKTTIVALTSEPKTRQDRRGVTALTPLGQAGPGLADIKDGAMGTAMLLDIADEYAVEWTKPVDFLYAPDRPLPELGSPDGDAAVVGFCDTKVYRVAKNAPEEVWRAIITRDGAETISFKPFVTVVPAQVVSATGSPNQQQPSDEAKSSPRSPGLIGAALQRLIGGRKKRRESSDVATIRSLSAACDIFRLDTARYPTDDEGLAVLVEAPADKTLARKWKGPYIADADLLVDSWGHPYRYQDNKEQSPRIYSMGPDGEDGTDDDFPQPLPEEGHDTDVDEGDPDGRDDGPRIMEQRRPTPETVRPEIPKTPAVALLGRHADTKDKEIAKLREQVKSMGARFGSNLTGAASLPPAHQTLASHSAELGAVEVRLIELDAENAGMEGDGQRDGADVEQKRESLLDEKTRVQQGFDDEKQRLLKTGDRTLEWTLKYLELQRAEQIRTGIKAALGRMEGAGLEPSPKPIWAVFCSGVRR